MTPVQSSLDLDTRQKFRIEIVDKDGNKEVVEREIDLNKIHTQSELEKEVLDFTATGAALMMKVSCKKNKKFWWSRIWWLIRNWSVTGKRAFKSKVS